MVLFFEVSHRDPEDILKKYPYSGRDAEEWLPWVASFGIAHMHYFYILVSEDSGKYYIGETSNLEERLKKHKNKQTSFGKRNKDLKLVYKLELNNRSEAKKLESFVKRQKSHKFIDKFISGKILIPL